MQASFFDAKYGLIDSSKKSQAEPNEYMQKFQQEMADAKNGKYNYLNPKKASFVPHEYVKTVLLKGTGFVGGRGRVCKIFETEIDAGTRAKRIKAEFGIGGSGWPIDGLGLHGYDTFKGHGIRFQWRDEEGETVYKVCLVYQSAEQLRSIEPLSLEAPPMIVPVFFAEAPADADGLIAEKNLVDLFAKKIDALDGIIGDYTPVEMEEAA